MPLVKQNLPISFNQGINTKLDDKSLIPGVLTVLENMVFTTVNKLTKRPGFTSLSNKEVNGAELARTRSLTSFGEELNLYTDRTFFTYSTAIDRWTDRGRVFNIIPTSTPIVRNSYQQSALSVGCLSDVNVYAWEDTRGGIRISVIDNINNSNFQSDVEISSSGVQPRVVPLESAGKIFIFYRVAGT